MSQWSNPIQPLWIKISLHYNLMYIQLNWDDEDLSHSQLCPPFQQLDFLSQGNGSTVQLIISVVPYAFLRTSGRFQTSYSHYLDSLHQPQKSS